MTVNKEQNTMALIETREISQAFHDEMMGQWDGEETERVGSFDGKNLADGALGTREEENNMETNKNMEVITEINEEAGVVGQILENNNSPQAEAEATTEEVVEETTEEVVEETTEEKKEEKNEGVEVRQEVNISISTQTGQYIPEETEEITISRGTDDHQSLIIPEQPKEEPKPEEPEKPEETEEITISRGTDDHQSLIIPEQPKEEPKPEEPEKPEEHGEEIVLPEPEEPEEEEEILEEIEEETEEEETEEEEEKTEETTEEVVVEKSETPVKTVMTVLSTPQSGAPVAMDVLAGGDILLSGVVLFSALGVAIKKLIKK